VSPADDPLLDAVRGLVSRVAGPSRTPPERGADVALAEAGFWLDSVELLEVVVACEEEFGITFDATRDLADGALATLGSLTALIRSKRARSPSSQ
jgi:acyl carrier protein